MVDNDYSKFAMILEYIAQIYIQLSANSISPHIRTHGVSVQTIRFQEKSVNGVETIVHP